MHRTARIILVIAGVVFFVVGAAAAAGWLPAADATACALVGFACWLASTAP